MTLVRVDYKKKLLRGYNSVELAMGIEKDFMPNEAKEIPTAIELYNQLKPIVDTLIAQAVNELPEPIRGK